MKGVKSAIALLLCLCQMAIAHAQPSPHAAEKSYFDFLLGKWSMQDRRVDGKWQPGTDTLRFEKQLDGNAIVSHWRFDRGTPAKPDVTEALYISAYDTRGKVWTFYYVSPQSAQYYEGRFESGNWFFHHAFTVDNRSFLQRQSWRMEDGLLVRSLENSYDNGQSWAEIYAARFKRAP